MVDSPARRWYHWYAPTDTPAERKLLLKLDFLVVFYGFILFWVKYIDQTNINNAYVSGMAKEFHFHGNELVDFQTIFTCSNVVGLIAALFVFPKVPMQWFIPGLELGWGVFTLLQYRAQSYHEILAYRFVIGLFEVPFYSGVHFVIGSWYRSDELARRGGFYHSALSLGTLTAGLLQAAASKHLDGVNGLPGWRWNFIITSIFPLALSLLGFVIFPGTPERPNLRVLSQSDLAIARARLEKGGAQVKSLPWSRTLLKRIFKDKKVYIIVALLLVAFQSGPANGGFLLWVKSLNRYSIPTLNNISTIQPAVAIFFVLVLNFGADMVFGRTPAFLFAATLNFISLIILVVWDVPESAKWFAFSIGGVNNGLTPIIYSWTNSFLRNDVDERALTLALMNIIATSSNAWVPLLVWQTKEAPRLPKGYPYAAAMTKVLILVALLLRWVYRKEEASLNAEGRDRSLEDGKVDSESTESPVLSVIKKALVTVEEKKIRGADHSFLDVS